MERGKVGGGRAGQRMGWAGKGGTKRLPLVTNLHPGDLNGALPVLTLSGCNFLFVFFPECEGDV